MLETDRGRLLKRIRIFDALPPDELARLTTQCRWSRHEAEREIVSYLDQSTSVQLLVEGRARVLIHSQTGKAVLFTDIEAGAVFGELAAIDGRPRSASVQALQPCLVASLTAAELNALMLRQPTVAVALLRSLVAQVRRLDERVLEFSTLSVQGRILAELSRLVAAFPPGSESVLITPAPSLSDFSARVSTHREAVSRELSRLAQLGIAVREGNGIRVLSRSRLDELVCAARGE